MKLSIPFIVLLMLGATMAPRYVLATPVAEEAIPKDIDWFVHLDADQFRSTQTGSALLREFTAIAQEEAGGNVPVNPVLVINGLRGLTLFGSMPPIAVSPENVDAVVMMDAAPELVQIFRGLISGMQIEKPEAIVETSMGAHTILSMQEAGIHGMFVGEERLILSKSLSSIEEFLAVKDQKVGHIILEERFPMATYNQETGLFFGAFVEGLKDVQNLPVQARILQLTKAVSIQLGESENSLNLLSSLATDSPTTAQQVQEVLRGILAIFVLTQNGNPELATLVQSANVQSNNETVSLSINYPVEAAVAWVGIFADRARLKIKEKNAMKELEESLEAAESTEEDGAEPAPAG